MDSERRQWLERVADAASRAADDLRRLDDASTHGLLEDLDDLHRRLTAELEATPSNE
jgi:hypothetical protein